MQIRRRKYLNKEGMKANLGFFVDIVIYLDNLALIFDFSSAPKEASGCNFLALCITGSCSTSFESSSVYLMGARSSRTYWLFHYAPHTPKNGCFGEKNILGNMSNQALH